jgi:hypothetical protein
MTIKISSLGLLAIAGSSAARHIRGPPFAESHVTSSDKAYNLTKFTAPVPGAGKTAATWHLTVDDTFRGHKQSITGFGGMAFH